MKTINNDLNVFYNGGSGGFLFLYFMLYSEQYYSSFEYTTLFNDVDSLSEYTTRLKKLEKIQFNISPHDNWKDFEFWPDDERTKLSKFNKIYFSCNITDYWFEKPGKKVLIYTDLAFRLLLAYYKKSSPFREIKGGKLKDKDKYTSIVINEFLNAETYNNNIVHSGFNELARHADIVINIRDVITNPQSVLDIFNLELNNNQSLLISNWIKQHPQYIQDEF